MEGTDVLFVFSHQKNHTATQSSFGTPCNRLTDQTSGAVIGLDSGLCVPRFHFHPSSLTDVPYSQKK